MKKILKIVFLIIMLLIIMFLIYRRFSLNSYLNSTIKYSNKINYLTNVDLNIIGKNYNQKLNYNIDRYSNIKKIDINKYNYDELENNIQKYIILKGSKKGEYILDNNEYIKSNIINEEININYEKLKKDIIRVKSLKTIKKDNIKLLEYTVIVKGYDAYNLIYNKEILKKEDYNKNIKLKILIDKKNNFVYEINYIIKDINENIDNYNVNIINTKINNKDKIELPF